MRHLLTHTPLALSGGLIFLAASVVVNVAYFGFHVLVARSLDLNEYGALGALLGIMLVFAVPATALQVTVAKEVAQQRASDADVVHLGPLVRQSLLAGVVMCATLVILSPVITWFLRLDSPLLAILLALYAIPSALAIVPRGVLLGDLRYGRVSLSMATGAFARLVLGAVLCGPLGLAGALMAIIIGDLLMVALTLPGLRSAVRLGDGGQRPQLHWRQGVGALVAFSGFWALAGVDTVLARHFLANETSGLYAAAATLARAALFAPAVAAALAFPHFAIDAGRSVEARRALLRCLGAVAAVSIPAGLFMVLLADLLLGIVFGDQYRAAAEALTPLVLSSIVLGLVSVFVHFHIAANARMVAAFSWLGVGAAVVGITAFHERPFDIAMVMFVVALVLLAALANVAFSRTDGPVGAGRWLGQDMWSDHRPELDLTVVVPYFNPGPGVVSTIERLHQALSGAGISYEIIAVSDGSTDGSQQLLAQLSIDHLRLVGLERNTGKGHALRLGLAMGRGEYLGFIDADGDVDPRILAPYLSLIRLYSPDVVLGSKRHPMSEVRYPPLRHIYSWGYQVLTYVLFRTKVRDTQTGLKLIRRNVLEVVLPVMMEKRFAFDLELLVVAKHLGFSKFFEAPIKIDHQFTSTISLRSVRGMLRDTLAIFYRLHMLRSYDRPANDPQRPLL